MVIKYNTNYITFKTLSVILIIYSISPIDLTGKLGSIYGYADLLLFVLWSIYALFFFNAELFHVLFSQKYVSIFLWPIYLMINLAFGRCTFAFAISNFKLTLLGLVFLILFECKFYGLLYWVKDLIVLYSILINVYTIYISQEIPGISRILASTSKDLTLLQTAFVGGYDYTYALSMGLPCIIWWRYRNKKKVTWIIFVATSIIYLITAQYTLSLLFFLLFCLIDFVLVSSKRAKILVPIFIILGIYSIIYFDAILLQISKILGNFSDQFVIRIDAAREYLNLGVTHNSGASERMSQWMLSLNAWRGNKWFGVGYSGYSSAGLVGGHSELIDKLAYFGGIGVVIFILMILFILKSVYGHLNGRYKVLYILSICHFMVVSFFTPTFANAEACVLFILLPIVLMEPKSGYNSLLIKG